jgi:hypothetical protein
MYNRQRPPLYYGGQKQKYYLTPSTAALPSWGAALSTNSNGTQSAHKGKQRGLWCMGKSTLLITNLPFSTTKNIVALEHKISVFARKGLK